MANDVQEPEFGRDVRRRTADCLTEDEMFELLSMRRAMRARDVSKPKTLEG